MAERRVSEAPFYERLSISAFLLKPAAERVEKIDAELRKKFARIFLGKKYSYEELAAYE